jgi:hypothetical protein
VKCRHLGGEKGVLLSVGLDRARDIRQALRHSPGMEDLVVTLAMLVMVVAGAGVIAYILRNKLDHPDLPSERANEMARAQAVERGNHSNMGPS